MSVDFHGNTLNDRIIHTTGLTWPPPAPLNNTVKDLGTAASVDGCANLCLGYTNLVAPNTTGWDRCQAFTFDGIQKTCVGVVDPLLPWLPVAVDPALEITSGLVEWPAANCSTDRDCSLNGLCDVSLARCVCDFGWDGDRCHLMRLVTPASPGLRIVEQDGRNTSTWGGSVVAWPSSSSSESTTLLHHMYAAEMINHCGIDSWTSNSRIIHAVAEAPGGPYQRADDNDGGVVFPVFSHEPNVIVAEDTGELVMFFTARNFTDDDDWPPPCNCTDGTTTAACGGGAEGNAPSWVSSAPAPEGPWSTPTYIGLGDLGIDTNLAALIHGDGSLVGMVRRSEAPQGSTIHLVTAADWRDGAGFQVDPEPLFPSSLVSDSGLEDPSLYRDERGNLHAVFHAQMESDDMSICGGHAYTDDPTGRTGWTFGGTAFNNTIGHGAAFTRRERPHVVFGDAERPRRPTHLSTGVQFGAAGGGVGEDGCFTLVQPLDG